MDIVAKLKKQAAICWGSKRIGETTKNRAASAMDEAAAEIEQLRSQLAARDREIADWLRDQWDGRPQQATYLADAIERGDYRKGKGGE